MKSIEEIKKHFMNFENSFFEDTRNWWKDPVVMVEIRKILSPIKTDIISNDYYTLGAIRYDDAYDSIEDFYTPYKELPKVDVIHISLWKPTTMGPCDLITGHMNFLNSTLPDVKAANLRKLYGILNILKDITSKRDDFPGYNINNNDSSHLANMILTYADIKIIKYYNKFEDLEKMALCFNPNHHLYYSMNHKGSDIFAQEFIAEYDYKAREFKKDCLKLHGIIKSFVEEEEI